MMFRIGDFVEVVAVNPVVQLTQVRETPRTHSLPEPLAPLVDGYLVVKAPTQRQCTGCFPLCRKAALFCLAAFMGRANHT